MLSHLEIAARATGAFVPSHPLRGFFRRTRICILNTSQAGMGREALDLELNIASVAVYAREKKGFRGSAYCSAPNAEARH